MRKKDQIKQTWQMGRNRNKQAESRTKFCVSESRAVLSFLEMDYKLFTGISEPQTETCQTCSV